MHEFAVPEFPLLMSRLNDRLVHWHASILRCLPVIGIFKQIDDLIDIGSAGVRIRVDIIHS